MMEVFFLFKKNQFLYSGEFSYTLIIQPRITTRKDDEKTNLYHPARYVRYYWLPKAA